MFRKLATPNMKRGAAMLLCTAALALPAMAQQEAPPPPPADQTQGPPPPPPPGGRHDGMRGGMRNPERRIEMLQKRLNLSPEQTTQVRTIFADARSRMEALRDDDTAKQDRRAKMASLMQEENTKVRAVLTPDQQKKYDVMVAEMRDRMRHGGPGRRGPGGAGNGEDAPPPPPPAE